MSAPDDGRTRCGWATGSALDVEYHDREWGVPERDPTRLFEALTLEGAQAGLSWSTILAKREGYRRVFHEFDVERIAAFTEAEVDAAVGDAGIVRHRGKITATVGNARAWLTLDDPVSLLWSFVGGAPTDARRTSITEVPAVTTESTAMSKELKRGGFRFVGPTTCYAFMQACGMVNDHTLDCFRHDEV